MVLTVLSVCSEEDRTFLQQMYGKKDAQCVASVKQLFNRYNVNEKFCAYEDTTNQRVKELIATNGFPARLIPVFQLLTQKLFRKAWLVCIVRMEIVTFLFSQIINQKDHLTVTNIN